MVAQHTWFTVEQFHKLLSIVGPPIAKQCKTTSGNPEERLLITLRVMETGSSSQTPTLQFRVGKTADTCEAIWNGLQTKQNSQEIAKFEQRWNFPHCIEALDGKHVGKAPANSQSEYYNYKEYFGILLLAMSDGKYKFTFVDIGSAGCKTDGGIFTKSFLGNMLKSGQLDLPNTKQIENYADGVFPHFIGNNVALPLKEKIMLPLSLKALELPPIDLEISEDLLNMYDDFSDRHPTYIGTCFYVYFGIGREIYEKFEVRQFGDDDFEDEWFEDEEDELPGHEWRKNVKARQLLQPLHQLRR